MKEVTKKEFYKVIGKQDACVKSEKNEYGQYTCIFTLRHGNVIGKSIDKDNFERKYYLNN